MTGLVLDEYEGVSEDELGPILKEEARKMFGPDLPDIDSGKRANGLHPLFRPEKYKRLHMGFRYLSRLMSFVRALTHIPQKGRLT